MTLQETIARAMRPYSEEVSPIALYEAGLALDAIAEAGLCVVPVEPTEAMLEAAMTNWGGSPSVSPITTRKRGEIYTAMIQAGKA